MGHEILHVVMRHSTRQASRQMSAQLPLAILGGALGMGVGGLAGSLAQMGISFASGPVFMKYSRDAETEADMVGAQIMHDAGYEPRAVVSFFNKLNEQSGKNRTPPFLSSHPDPGNRAKEINRILSRFPAKQYQQSESAEFLAAKKALADVKAVQNKSESSTPLPRLSLSNIADSNIKNFQHAAYTISYPANWRLNGDSASTVTIYPEGGLGDGLLAYGAMISGFQPKASAAKELDAAMRELIADIEQTIPIFASTAVLRFLGRPVFLRAGSIGPANRRSRKKRATERACKIDRFAKKGWWCSLCCLRSSRPRLYWPMADL